MHLLNPVEFFECIMFQFIDNFVEVTWKHGSGSSLQIFLEAEAEAKVYRFHIMTGIVEKIKTAWAPWIGQKLPVNI